MCGSSFLGHFLNEKNHPFWLAIGPGRFEDLRPWEKAPAAGHRPDLDF